MRYYGESFKMKRTDKPTIILENSFSSQDNAKWIFNYLDNY